VKATSNKSLDFSTASQQALYANMVLPVNTRWHELTEAQQRAAVNLGARPPGTMKNGKLHAFCWGFLREHLHFYPAFNFCWSKKDQTHKTGGHKKFLTEKNKQSLKVLKIRKSFFCNSNMEGRKKAYVTLYHLQISLPIYSNTVSICLQVFLSKGTPLRL